MSELKRCPFCLGEANFSETYSPKMLSDFVCIKCDVCGAQTRAIPVKIGDLVGRERTAETLTKLWESRRQLDEAIRLYEED